MDFDRCGLTGEKRAHRAVRLVAHPARKAELVGLLGRPPAEGDPLHPSGDGDAHGASLLRHEDASMLLLLPIRAPHGLPTHAATISALAAAPSRLEFAAPECGRRAARRSIATLAMNGKTQSVLLSIGLLLMMTVATIFSPTLYRLYTNYTRVGGTTQPGTAADTAAADGVVTVRFDANVAPGLDWDFKPEQREITTHFGQHTRVYYTATNNTDQTIVARAAFSVTPDPAVPYLFAVQGFCCNAEKLGPHQSVRVPVVFYVDGRMLNNQIARANKAITLSYTFFGLKNPSPAQVAAASDLADAERQTAQQLAQPENAAFRNDASGG